MHINSGTHLRELDALSMQFALAGISTEREPQPQYRVFYRISLMNTRRHSVQLLGRKWLLQDICGNTRIIEAGQVFNDFPVLSPGAVFSWAGSQLFQQPPQRMELRVFGRDHTGSSFISPALKMPFAVQD